MSLSDKLKSLGVQVGAQDLKPPPTRRLFSIDRVIKGRFEETAYGETFVVDKCFPIDTAHGCTNLCIDAPLDSIAEWAHEPRLKDPNMDTWAFLDTETTGLGFGAGTLAFMVGVARYEGESFRLAQFFVRDPSEERAMLAALEAFVAPCQVLVTFNGKAFDAPLLKVRYRMHKEESPLTHMAHLDLLSLARRLWKDRLASRSLGSLEEHILYLPRTHEDVPGWMIPPMYFEYLRTGDARPLKGIFYHNEIDILSMAALLNLISTQFANPLADHIHPIDVISIAKVFESIDPQHALDLYAEGLKRDLPQAHYWRTIERLSFIYKRKSQWSQAIELWEQAAQAEQIYAHIELAKYYEHRQKDYSIAIKWTEAAIEYVHAPNFLNWEKASTLAKLTHRLKRLNRKQERAKSL